MGASLGGSSTALDPDIIRRLNGLREFYKCAPCQFRVHPLQGMVRRQLKWPFRAMPKDKAGWSLDERPSAFVVCGQSM
jgi:hypothetical protein